MKEYCVEIFGEKICYDQKYSLESDIIVIQSLKKAISEEFIVSLFGDYRYPIEFCLKDEDGKRLLDDHFIGHKLLIWLYDLVKSRTNKSELNAFIATCCTETDDMKKWTDWRNEDSPYLSYRKMIFLPEIQDMIRLELTNYQKQLEQIMADMIAQELKAKNEREERKSKWKLLKTYRDVKPKGGEMGVDGYFDAEYISDDGEIIRMVSRDLFDFGTFSYPKRLEGKDDLFEKLKEIDGKERSLLNWLVEFGPFHEIRM